MDAKFRKWFSRRSRDGGSARFKTQSYDSAKASTAPYQGSFPVAGNGPVSLEMLHSKHHASRQHSPDSAAPPNIQRGRRSVDTDRRPASARSAFRSIPFKGSGRRRSASSLDGRRKSNPQFTWNYTCSHSLSHGTPTLLSRDQVRSISAFEPDPPPLPTAHVDLLDALSTIKPSPGTHVQRIRASGRRDYGEDVADRNLAFFGGGELDSMQYQRHSGSPDRTHSLETHPVEGRAGAAGMRGNRQSQQWPGPARGSHAARFWDDGAGDDTALRHSAPRGRYSVLNYVDDHQCFFNPPTLKPAITPTGSRYSNVNKPNYAAPQRARSVSSFHSATHPQPTAAYKRSSSITSTRSYLLPRYQNNALTEPKRPASTPTHRLHGLYPSTSNQSIASPTVSTQLAIRPEYANSSTQTDLDIEPRYTPQDSSSVSQMSLTTSGSPTSIPKSSLEKEPPPTPDQLARARSNKYSASRMQEQVRHSEDSDSLRTSEDSAAAFPPDIRKPAGRVEGFSASALPPGFDLSNTTDTEVITNQRPAVVHEYVIPKVHEIKERQITREIHTHDVFHRIQPIVDVEVLPTKHYISAPNGNGIIEVPASAVPGRHTEWEVRPVEDISKASQRNLGETSHQIFSSHEPVPDSEQQTTSPAGIPRSEKVWRHPAELETGGQLTSQTVPIHLRRPVPPASDFSDEYDDAVDQQSTHTANEAESELLFKDSDHAFGGALPGLEEPNPVVEGTTAPVHIPPRSSSSGRVPGSGGEGDGYDGDEEGVGEATKALRRRQADITTKMKGLSVGE